MIGHQRITMPGVSWGPAAAGALLAGAVVIVALVLSSSGRAGEGFISQALLPAGLGAIAVTGWLLTLMLRDNETSLRVIAATLGFVVVGGFALVWLGSLGDSDDGVRAFYRPGTAAGMAGLWLMGLAAIPFSAAAALDYRRSDPWYSWPMTAVVLTWLAIAGITVVDVLARLYR